MFAPFIRIVGAHLSFLNGCYELPAGGTADAPCASSQWDGQAAEVEVILREADIVSCRPLTGTQEAWSVSCDRVEPGMNFSTRRTAQRSHWQSSGLPFPHVLGIALWQCSHFPRFVMYLPTCPNRLAEAPLKDTGYVTSVKPLVTVLETPEARGYEWEEVRQIPEGEGESHKSRGLPTATSVCHFVGSFWIRV